MNNPAIIAAAAIVLLAGAGCSNIPEKKQPPAGVESNTQEQQAPTPVAVTTSISVEIPTVPPAPAIPDKTIVVTGSNFTFSPSSLSVKKGQKVTLTFKNTGGMHDFKIDELGVATKKIRGGEEDAVVFTPDKTGVFEFYCSVGEHRAMGMKGTIVVE